MVQSGDISVDKPTKTSSPNNNKQQRQTGDGLTDWVWKTVHLTGPIRDVRVLLCVELTRERPMSRVFRM